ncbi:Biopolymer transport protein ExbD1 [Moritella sp. JT01]|uniref:ExbD/TolR family protein n=1 Tax=Moritella sp. JT01 TaxID=756698 RepID=UPI0007966550|nr:biopolymer transporter ExbD [Moritella sp. JT01]KXO12895.1 Biopolymer transport protein ExbD1 [Moritella sp. JT01]
MIKVSQDNETESILPDLTPLLDIIFIVMVFLLLTASIKLQTLEVDLPTSDNAVTSEVDNKSVTINILAQAPYWALQGEQFSDWESFTTALVKLVTDKSDAEIVIASDKTAQIQHMVKLLAFLQKNKISATQLLIEEE